jgi:probable rRNA maturation factor
LGAEGYAGDLAISVPTARKQAVEQGHTLSVEIKVLILHGLLHLAGYDHEADEGEMARRERLLRTKLRLPPGLIERVENPVSQKSVILSDRSAAKGVEGPVVRPDKQAIKLRVGKSRTSTDKRGAKP